LLHLEAGGVASSLAMMETETYTGAGISIYVPITGTNEAVAVPVDQLPEDVDEVLGILQAELAPLGLWLDFAKAYLQRGKEEQFRAILESGCSPGE
jgi:RNA polymerase-associated protein CTR9